MWLQLDFCAVRSKSCNSKSNCPIGIKIDMYTHKKYVKAGWKGFFFSFGRKGGILTPVSWRKSNFVTKEMAPADRLLKVSFKTLITSSVFKIFKIYKMLLKNKSATVWNIFLKVQDLVFVMSAIFLITTFSSLHERGIKMPSSRQNFLKSF